MIIHRGPIAIARIPRTPVEFVAYAHAVLFRLTGNASLPNPNPSLAVFGAAISVLDAAQAEASTDGGKCATAHRDRAASVVRRHIGHLVDYVQSVSEQQPTPDAALQVILRSGFSVRKTGGYVKPDLAVRHSGIPGAVLLVARAVKNAGIYCWEYRAEGEPSWIEAPATTAIRTSISGLVPGTAYFFRFRALTSAGKTEYTQSVRLIVH